MANTAGLPVVGHAEIANHYIRGWFICDLVSSVPFDLVSYMANSDNSFGAASTAKALKTGRIIKVLRVLKLSKVLRLARAYKMTLRLEEELDLVGRAPMRIVKIVVSTAFMCHIFACGWASGTLQLADMWPTPQASGTL